MKTFADFGIELGNRSGTQVKVLCPRCSPHRKKARLPCLSVNVDEGIWNCWHCGWSGTTKGGEQAPSRPPKIFIKPRPIPPAPPADSVIAWFAERGIPQAIVERNGIVKTHVWFPQVEGEQACIAFPYVRGGEVINVKYRTRDKLFRMHAGAERVLYGLDDIDAGRLVWVEGEMDKLAIEVAGIVSCVSVPDGAPTPDTKAYETKFDFLSEARLADVARHVIAVDADAPGQRLAQELVRRLGPEKCWIVTWPENCKDANDVLLACGPAVLRQLVDDAKPVPIEGTLRPGELLAEIEYDYDHGIEKGVSTGWTSMDDVYRVMPGEWTLVTGIPGHGKSEWLDALIVNLARQYGWTFAMFSPENQPPKYHAEKIAEKFVGKSFAAGWAHRMSLSEARDALAWIDAHITFVQPAMPTIEELLSIGRQLVLRHGIRGFVIDPWNEIDHSRAVQLSETEHISQCLSKIRAFARLHGIHVFIVAHPTKLQKGADGQYPVPTPYDVAGSAHWRNKADNCLTVWRDTKADNATVEVHVQKIRKKANGKVGMVPLRYVRSCGQYHDDPEFIRARYESKEAA